MSDLLLCTFPQPTAGSQHTTARATTATTTTNTNTTTITTITAMPAGNVQLSPWPTLSYLLFGEESITLQKTICNSGNLGETVATSFSTMIQHFLSSKSVQGRRQRYGRYGHGRTTGRIFFLDALST